MEDVDEDDGGHGGAGGADAVHDGREDVETGGEGEPEEDQPDVAAGQVEDLVAGADETGHVGPEGRTEKRGACGHGGADEERGERGPPGLFLPSRPPEVGDDHRRAGGEPPEYRHGDEDEELPQPHGGDGRGPEAADQEDVDDGDEPLEE